MCALNLDLVREGVEEAMPMSVFGDEPSASSSTATDSWLLDMIEPMTLTQELRLREGGFSQCRVLTVKCRLVRSQSERQVGEHDKVSSAQMKEESYTTYVVCFSVDDVKTSG